LKLGGRRYGFAVTIADHHDVFRAGLRAIIEDNQGWHVVAEDGGMAVAQAIETRPDVAVVDDFLPVLNGAVRRIDRRAMAKINATSTADLVRYAIKRKLSEL
jgi:DNA-binding NarL/FixJ family response regulator